MQKGFMMKFIFLLFVTVISTSYAGVNPITPEQFAAMDPMDQYRVIEYRPEATRVLPLWGSKSVWLPYKTKTDITVNISNIAQKATFLWMRTTLKDEYMLPNFRYGYTPIFVYVNANKIIAYRTRVYTDAFDITNCDYKYSGKLDNCWPGELQQEIILNYKFERVLQSIHTPIFYED